MPARDILVVIDNETAVARQLAPLAALAKRMELRVTGFFATGLPAATSFGDLASGAQLVDAYMTAQRAEATKAEQAFGQEIARLKLAGTWHCRETDMTEGVIVQARLHDLVVMGQPDPDADAEPGCGPKRSCSPRGGLR